MAIVHTGGEHQDCRSVHPNCDLFRGVLQASNGWPIRFSRLRCAGSIGGQAGLWLLHGFDTVAAGGIT